MDDRVQSRSDNRRARQAVHLDAPEATAAPKEHLGRSSPHLGRSS